MIEGFGFDMSSMVVKENRAGGGRGLRGVK